MSLERIMLSILIAGRCLLSLIFVVSGLNHLLAFGDMARHATAEGVPFPEIAVIGTGVMIVAGGLSIALGFHARAGAWLLVVFLVPTTFVMHAFWNVEDEMMAQNQMIHFMKNASMMGGAMVVAYFGSGPGSLRPS